MISEQKNNSRSGIGFFAILLVVIILGILMLKVCKNTGSKTPEAKKNVTSETADPEIINDTFSAPKNSLSEYITRKVYFCRISEDGTQKMLAAFRKISSVDSLDATLEALLAGPTNAEAEHDIITNIPENTILKSSRIEGDTAFLDFSSEFEVNSFGRDSAMLQLKQIVFTVTEYSDIKKVQFLINGENRTYLGGDGVVIGKPLSRDDFS